MLLVAQDGKAKKFSSNSQVLTPKKIPLPVSKSWHDDASAQRMQQVALASPAEHLHDAKWILGDKHIIH